MRTVAFINLKGGVGKTVSAANVAHILNAYHHKKVLLVDGDKQGSASRHFGLYGEQDGTAALLLDPERDPLEAVYHTGCRGLDIITSNMELYEADRVLYDTTDFDITGTLKAVLDKLADDYDFGIIDNGPSVDTVALNVLAAADDVLVPIRPDEFSFSGLLDLVEQVGSAGSRSRRRAGRWRKAVSALCSRRLSATIRRCRKARWRKCRCARSRPGPGPLSSTRS